MVNFHAFLSLAQLCFHLFARINHRINSLDRGWLRVVLYDRMIVGSLVSAGVPMNVEDTWGGDVTQAAIAALAHSTPPELLFCATDFNSYGPVTIADTAAVRQEGTGRMVAPAEPGLGVFPRWDVLGGAVYDTDADARPRSECPNKPFAD